MTPEASDLRTILRAGDIVARLGGLAAHWNAAYAQADDHYMTVRRQMARARHRKLPWTSGEGVKMEPTLWDYLKAAGMWADSTGGIDGPIREKLKQVRIRQEGEAVLPLMRAIGNLHAISLKVVLDSERGDAGALEQIPTTPPTVREDGAATKQVPDERATTADAAREGSLADLAARYGDVAQRLSAVEEAHSKVERELSYLNREAQAIEQELAMLPRLYVHGKHVRALQEELALVQKQQSDTQSKLANWVIRLVDLIEPNICQEPIEAPANAKAAEQSQLVALATIQNTRLSLHRMLGELCGIEPIAIPVGAPFDDTVMTYERVDQLPGDSPPEWIGRVSRLVRWGYQFRDGRAYRPALVRIYVCETESEKQITL